MRIRQISDKVQQQFPEISPVDFFQVWKSFEVEINKNLFEPELPYLQFLNLGTLFVTNASFNKKINHLKKAITFIEKWEIKDVNWEGMIVKVQEYQKLVELKKDFYSKFLIYLEGLDTIKAIHGRKYYTRKVKEYEDLSIQATELIKEYDKRIIARDLEKQITDSRGNKESDL